MILVPHTQLQVTDVDNSTTQVTYTLTDIPDNGTLLRNNLALAINDTFTQADIDSNLLNYTHNGSETTSDSFSFTVADGAGGAIANTTFNITVNPVNDNPILVSAIANQTATEETAFSFQIPTNTFSDVDTGDTLTYTATLENGNALPIWLTFDAATRTFSGTPSNADVITLSIQVIATDNSGASVNDIFTLTVANTNNAPILGNAIANQTATEDTAFTFAIPENTFADVDAGDSLTYTATLENGDALPTWLTFDAATRTFSGTPANNDVATLSIKVTATDNFGSSVDDIFTLTVANTNDAPILGVAIADQNATQDIAFNFTIPANTFSDIDAGDILTYTATLENGEALPSWLSFDAATRTFIGTPISNSVGNLNINVIASDSQGATAEDIFALAVAATNVINGNDTNNNISGTANADNIYGFDGDDYLQGLAGNDLINGGTGKFDLMFGGAGDDTITDPDGILGAYGGTGNDTINVTFAVSWDNDTNSSNAPRSDGKITGGYGDDNITVTMNNSQFFINLKGDGPTNSFQDGNDVITLLGSYQNAIVDLGGGNDTFVGGNGSDDVSGGAGNDTIFGFGGNDRLVGNDGNDILAGGAGNDNLTGGSGQDFFSFSSLTGNGIDSITDFNLVDDKIRVDAAGFGGGLVAGALPETRFVLGTADQDESDRFIYNQSSGTIFFDVDGTGSTTAVQIATLLTKPTINSTNIMIV
ncbi:putative Ig domain-containing protein [Nostoc sp. WHI]|uniref:putative Ig domain-containing protein n=1 Tax=Nostoc sp. WHI TaxID=2650611 RepID=UPI0018C4996E|nr:putative Ig domain-containing protein [Nostoc sp. WHI]MBG1265067.1 hypothetical protein [Nostoc sp. WHI]